MTGLSRRNFLARSTDLGLLTLLSAALPRSVLSDPLGIPAGIQLYTVNELLQSDPGGTLKELYRIGYRNAETAGTGKLSAKDFRQLLDDAGLVCPSAHVNFMTGETGALFEQTHALGAHYAVSSILRQGTGAQPILEPSMMKYADMMRAMTLDDAKRMAELANKIGEKAKQAGLQYAYHNHFPEFVDQGHGEVAYDVLLKETDPELVKFEIDCGWMVIAGQDPVKYLNKFPHRFPMIHVKDFAKVDGVVPPGMRVGTELGTGFIDYKPIFAAAKTAGLKYYFAEQEGPYTHMTQMEAAKVSFEYLHALRV